MTDTPNNSWRELFAVGGLAVPILIGGTALQAMEGFIASAMLPTVVRDIGGLEFFAWNTTTFIVASILATLFAAVRPASIGPRSGYIIAAFAFGLGSLICGLAPAMLVLLLGRFVQGFGAGLIIAQGFSMLRIVFPERLWPRAMALNASIWGIATLLGPAVGGSFAEFGQWRWAFLAIVPAAALLALGAWRILPATSEAKPPTRLPVTQIILVTAIVLTVSVASLLTTAPVFSAVLVAAGLFGIVLLGVAETRSRTHLLPDGAFRVSSPMSGMLALTLILGVGVTADIFAPLFLQRLHGLTPLWAGYITALVAAGWSTSAITTSDWTGARVNTVLTVAPIIMLIALIGLALTIAQATDSIVTLALAGASLYGLGMGIGTAFQHLSTRILGSAPAADNDRTSAALGMVQLFAAGLGAAIGGVAANMAGLPVATDPAQLELAARVVFAVFALIVAIGVPLGIDVSRRSTATLSLQPAE